MKKDLINLLIDILCFIISPFVLIYALVVYLFTWDESDCIGCPKGGTECNNCKQNKYKKAN